MRSETWNKLGALLNELLTGYVEQGDNLCGEMCNAEQEAAWEAEKADVKRKIADVLDELAAQQGQRLHLWRR